MTLLRSGRQWVLNLPAHGIGILGVATWKGGVPNESNVRAATVVMTLSF